MKKCTYFAAVAFALLALVLMPMEGHAQTSIPECLGVSVIDDFPVPPEFSAGTVHGMAFDGKSLWAACHGGTCDSIYELGFDTSGDMIVVDSIDAPTSLTTGITFVGKNLFSGSVFLSQTITKQKTTGKNAGEIKDSFEVPFEDCTGLTYDGDILYNSDFVWSTYGGKIHKVKINGDLIASYFFPRWNCPEGLAFDGEFIWLAEWCQNKIYKLNADDLTPVCYFDGPGPGGTPIGLTFDNSHLWLADQATQTFYKIDIGLGQ